MIAIIENEKGEQLKVYADWWNYEYSTCQQEGWNIWDDDIKYNCLNIKQRTNKNKIIKIL